jgi:hypothetical protein
VDLQLFRKKLASECEFNSPDPDAAYERLIQTGEYIRLLEDPQILARDPVDILFDGINLSTGPTHQLLSGFRGASKTTTLLRLQKKLRDTGYTAFRIDVEDYLSTAVAPGPVEFLLFLAVAFEEAIHELVPETQKGTSIWNRVKMVFRRIDVDVDPIEVAVEQQFGPMKVSAKLKLLLKDESFIKQLRDSTAGTLPALSEQIREGIRELVKHALEVSNVPEGAVVVLVDSVEHYRGNIQTAADIQAAVQTLFDVHANVLRFDLPALHVIYTVPPYLRELVPTAPGAFGTPNVRVIPAVKIFDRVGNRWEPGFAAMSALAQRRIEQALRAAGETKLTPTDIIPPAVMDLFVEASGGLPRELLRVLHETNLQLQSLPVDELSAARILKQLIAGRGTIPDSDALVLAQIDAEKAAALPKLEDLTTLARLLEYGSVLCYQNDDDWYAVNPLIRQAVLDQVKRIHDRVSPVSDPSTGN